MSTIEQPIENVLIQEANFLAAAPIITHTQQIATSLLLRRASNKLESKDKALAEMRTALEHCGTFTEHTAETEQSVCVTCAIIGHALSSDCGKNFIHKSQLEAAQKRIWQLKEALASSQQMADTLLWAYVHIDGFAKKREELMKLAHKSLAVAREALENKE